MSWRIWLLGVCLVWLGLLSLEYADAAAPPSTHVELSLMAGYSTTTFGGNASSMSRQYSGEIGVKVVPVTEVEVSYSYMDSYMNQQPYQTSTSNQQTLALSIVQNLVPATWPLQPFVKAGAAQLNRTESGTQNGLPIPDSSSHTPAGVLGAGIRIFFYKGFSVKAEATSYLNEFEISQYQNNLSAQAGLSWQF